MQNSESEYRLEMTGISKSFGQVSVLGNVNLKVKHGEIHALLGENGAGKSTLMKILSGVHQKDAGTVLLNGEEINPKNTHDGQVLGINVVYQELSLVNDLSVAENIYLHKLGASKFWMNWKKITHDAQELINSLGFNIDATATVRDLSIVQKQVVEIAKAISEDTKVLVLDEPTTVFDPTDAQKLFDNLLRLKKTGISIIYISHHLDEIFKIADTVTVLKDGVDTGSMPVSETDTDGVIRLMIGRELKDLYPVRDVKVGEVPIFEVKNLTAKDTLVHDVSFSVRAGEVLGIAGLGGSGRTETAKLIFGADKKKSGSIFLHGEEIKTKSPVDAVGYEIGLVSENRKEEGVFLPLSIRRNISVTNFGPISSKLGFISVDKETKNAQDLIEKLNIKTVSSEVQVKNLSGGNQQKVALAKWLSVNSKVIIIDEPTRGVDVGAKVEIYNLINEVAKKGVAVIVISSDMPEIMGISDRILVMHEGSIYGELPKENFSEENILRYSIGEQLK
ncbi:MULTISPECIES: sugar ABC transporter ATP-binding protein [Cellulophaga]|jgi:ribose transport system ATP-binding protein|uniref:Lantibiotic ABC transporter permease n=1 Tax=Cellulophaga baltica 18 TaxID=1348584 RepID=A0AAU8REF4_9FLAO|nr:MULTISPECIES: sugar ABC transporter ATP-binding protein [Cellulophaga]AIZ41915.1 lantibiotic ABC transporter permease [Cellulophaga baltica 18]KGK30909.1 lantibiotic ABC transporter permease [Cellulophaga sp. E6(2014)]MBA6316044.1 sugar ABC transporter ATP-binding protein [Cellulophaga baltica]